MSKELNLLSRTQMSGHFTMTVHGGRRGTLVLAEFDNLITDAGLNDVFASVGGNVYRCQLGTGVAAPTAADVALANPGPSSTTTQRGWTFSGNVSYVAGPPDYTSDYVTLRFAAGAATGTWTEVGMTRHTAPYTLWSRALIVDGGGSPTSVTVLADESLDVTYTLRVYPQAGDVTGNVDISGTNHSYVMRPSDVASWKPYQICAGVYGYAGRTATGQGNWSAYTGGIGLRTGYPSGTASAGAVDVTAAAYVGNSLQRTFELKYGLGTHNPAGGIKSLVFAPYSSSGSAGLSHQIEFTPAIPKDNTKILRLNFTASFARRP